jgi:hypothetical protein
VLLPELLRPPMPAEPEAEDPKLPAVLPMLCELLLLPLPSVPPLSPGPTLPLASLPLPLPEPLV